MKNTGIVRRVDDLGRIVLPKELRRTMRIKEGDPLEIHVEGETICLKQYKQDIKACVFCCTDHEILIEMDGKYICLSCLDKLTKGVPK